MSISREEAETLLNNLHKLSAAEQKAVLVALEELEAREWAERARNSLLDFAIAMMPDYKVGAHHKQLAQWLEDMAYGRKSRVTVSIAPRFGKSQLTSIFFPAWFIGNWPDKKIMMVSHTADLAVDFGRKVRNIVATEEYKRIFPDVSLAVDSKSAGRWSTNRGGEYFAVGIGGAIAGRGAHFLCLAGSVQVKTKDDGIIPIKHLQIGAKISTVTGWERVTNKWLTIHIKKVKINSIEASLEHPFLTPKGWVHAGELRVGDRILTQTLWRTLWTTIASHLKHLHAKLGKA